MKFGWSAEVTLEVQKALNTIAPIAASYLDTALSAPPLDAVDIEICYVPVLMNKHHIGNYPARSRRSIKERTIYCAPQLDHDRWIAGDQTDKMDVWMTGLNDAIVYLERFGVSGDQLEAFKACIARRPRPNGKERSQ